MYAHTHTQIHTISLALSHTHIVKLIAAESWRVECY